MLRDLLIVHRDEVVARMRAKAEATLAQAATPAEAGLILSLFLAQLTEILECEGKDPARPAGEDLRRDATRLGAELRRAGFTVGQVVHAYGDICQAVTELAVDLGRPISVEDFRILNRCLDEAIAQAVTEFGRGEELSRSQRATERLCFVGQELRNLLANATLAFDALQQGTVGVAGSTGAILEQNLFALRDLIDRTLADVRLEAGLHRRERVSLSALIEDAAAAAILEARTRGLRLTVAPADAEVAIDVDPHLIAAALSNVLQNAFKFSRPSGHVVLRTDPAAAPGRVLIEVEDECGGLPPGRAESLFRPFGARGAGTGALERGLAVAREGVETSGGEIRARSLAGHGCIVTIDLPRHGGAATPRPVRRPPIERDPRERRRAPDRRAT